MCVFVGARWQCALVSNLCCVLSCTDESVFGRVELELILEDDIVVRDSPYGMVGLQCVCVCVLVVGHG